MNFVTRIFRSVSLKSLQQLYFIICDALRDLVPFVQFQKSKKHPWRSVTFGKIVG